jgi:uncharacterized coiled-coil protein SlyX
MGTPEDQQDATIDSLRMQIERLEREFDAWMEELRRLNERMDAVEDRRP